MKQKLRNRIKNITQENMSDFSFRKNSKKYSRHNKKNINNNNNNNLSLKEESNDKNDVHNENSNNFNIFKKLSKIQSNKSNYSFKKKSDILEFNKENNIIDNNIFNNSTNLFDSISKENIKELNKKEKSNENSNPNNNKTLSDIIKTISFKSNTTKEDKLKKRKDSILTSRTQRTNSESIVNQIKERSKLLKPKFKIGDDGKLTFEKPDVEEINNNVNSNITNQNINNLNTIVPTNEVKQRITSLSFRKRVSIKKWTEEETEIFYKSLNCIGADFSILSMIFPGRNRLQLKNKFKIEQIKNHEKINSHIKNLNNKKAISLVDILLKNNKIDKKDFKLKIKEFFLKSCDEENEINIHNNINKNITKSNKRNNLVLNKNHRKKNFLKIVKNTSQLKKRLLRSSNKLNIKQQNQVSNKRDSYSNLMNNNLDKHNDITINNKRHTRLSLKKEIIINKELSKDASNTSSNMLNTMNLTEEENILAKFIKKFFPKEN